MKQEEVRQLLIRYQNGECSETEKAFLEQSILVYNEDEPELDASHLAQIKEEIFARLPKETQHTKPLKIWVAISGAAAGLIITLAILINTHKVEQPDTIAIVEKIFPMENLATITLANGKQLLLSTTRKEVMVNDTSLRYNNGEQINIIKRSEIQTIQTLKGGEYKIVLSDGTKVWLNAATVLQYPTSFRERIERKVTLVSGEAYFEVAKDRKHPFVVYTRDQRLTVLGTHFNINAYDKSVKTVLVEGSVKLNSTQSSDSIKLKAGEKSVTVRNRFEKTDADIALEMAWIKGKMKFKNADLRSILSEAERWYNIQVVYIGDIPKINITGGMDRKSSLATLLKLLKMSGVNYNLEEKSGKHTIYITQ
jgi:transmembrane sensor